MSTRFAFASSLYLGIISGTSADGIDVALIQTEPAIRLLAGHTYPWDDRLRAQLLCLGQGHDDIQSLDLLGQLDAQVGLAFADAALQLLDDANIAPSRVHAIGSHGQTLRHRPAADPPFSMQIGDGSRIAEHTGITTVTDFRRRDIAAGGHGAPLVPAFHRAMLHSPDESRAVLNLGGIANLTLLPRTGPVRGFDTGPANALLDAWCQRHTGMAFDRGGVLATRGKIDHELLERLLADPWFRQPPPKSTGREMFHLDWLRPRLGGTEPVEDVQATLAELTAMTVTDQLRMQQPDTERVLVCGGGVHNPLLMQRLSSYLPDVASESTARYGLDPDFVEAMAFAWLARETLAGRPGNLPAVTGAEGLRILGAIHPA
ncbi:MAG: anhydro-N-acetylmuramic acid kinase [Xanthomonadaceae bacterium]|jgi:anhydro-N-acetylmuramic acid kinase|nr:anhydro-N-acetylmuramic acid kinase [Xanthomonadaceae bacterium]